MLHCGHMKHTPRTGPAGIWQQAAGCGGLLSGLKCRNDEQPREADLQTMTTIAADSRWQVLLRRPRDPNADFVYAVVTTGIYCRPSCPARLPNPGNVRFFAGCAQAAADGYRACKRCKPDAPAEDRHATLVAAACRAIEAAETPPTLADLATEAGLSPFHFHRLFKQATGLTPRAYAQAHRAKRVQAGLAGGGNVTATMYEAGFNASSRFYAAADGMLGMTPRAYRAGGAHQHIHFAVGTCSLGAILVAASSRGVCAILLGDDPAGLENDLHGRFPRAAIAPADAGFQATVDMVVAMVEAPRLGTALPLDVQGTAFQQRVWNALRAIPAGTTVSYAQLAALIGAPKAVRAVAAACAANRLAVAIPCHRVVGKHGALTGYRWGIARKGILLAREAE